MTSVENKVLSRVTADLLNHLERIEIIDTHEHLPAEAERLAEKVDFSKLFSPYCAADLESAGMSRREVEDFLSDRLDVEAKWRLFEPYYREIKNGSYARAARLAMDKFYGRGDLRSLEVFPQCLPGFGIRLPGFPRTGDAGRQDVG